MDFQDADDQVLPDVNVDQIINEIAETNNCTIEQSLSKLLPTDNTNDQITNSGDAVSKLEPFATTSKSKNVSVTGDTKGRGIQEFVRILRPHLPRKSKSKAYKMLQNIAKGIIVESSFRRRILRKIPKKRPQRKPRVRNTKTKSLGAVRRNARSVYGSSDSSPSDASCPRCGYSCCKVSRY